MSQIGSASTKQLFSFGDTAYQVDLSQGAFKRGKGDWSDVYLGTTIGKKAYLVGNTGLLYEVDLTTMEHRVVSNESWHHSKGLIAYNGHLYAFCHQIYKINVENGTAEEFKTSDKTWETTVAVGVVGDKAYVAQKNGFLYEISLDAGDYKILSHQSWDTTRAFVTYNDKLYAFCFNVWVIDPVGGTFEKLKSDIDYWHSVKSVAVDDNIAYVATDNGEMYALDLNTGSAHLISNRSLYKSNVLLFGEVGPKKDYLTVDRERTGIARTERV